MSACGFSGKGNGIKSMYNFRFERELKDKFAHCRFPCSCKGCYERLQQPTTHEHYNTPRDSCYLWPIMEISDDNDQPTGKGTVNGRWGGLRQGKIARWMNITPQRQTRSEKLVKPTANRLLRVTLVHIVCR